MFTHMIIIHLLLILSKTQDFDFSQIFDLIGGHWSDIESYPFMAAVVIKSRYYCGGTILSVNHILTAAQCVAVCPNNNLKRRTMCHSGHPNDYHVITGNTFLIDVDNDITNVLRVLLHPKFGVSKDGCSYKNDLGVIYLKTNLVFSTSIQPVRFQPLRHTKQKRRKMTYKMAVDGVNCIGLGWGVKRKPQGMISGHGRYLKNDEIFHYLKEAVMSLIPNGVCDRILLQNSSMVTCSESNICALHDNNSFCIEDTGGPLMCGSFQIAVASWTGGCWKDWSPIVFTPLDKHLEWIRNTYNDDVFKELRGVSSASVLIFSCFKFVLCFFILITFAIKYENEM